MKILVTALGTMASKCIVEQMRKDPNNHITGVDIYPKDYIVSSRDVDEFIQISSVVENENYLDELIDICIKNQIELVYPIIDEEVELLSQNIRRLHDLGIIPCVSNERSVYLCRNKLATAERIRKRFPEIYIKTALLSEYQNEFRFPLFIKPIKGRSSIGCMKINSNEELSFFKNRLNSQEYLVQEYVEGQFFSADVARNPLTGVVDVLVREELLRNSNGAGIVVRTLFKPELIAICRNLAEDFDIKGVANIEFVKDGSNYKLIEINPRLPAGTQFSCIAGFDIVTIQKDIMLGKIPEKSEMRYDIILARRYETYEM